MEGHGVALDVIFRHLGWMGGVLKGLLNQRSCILVRPGDSA
jgi:hypothetical protein